MPCDREHILCQNRMEATEEQLPSPPPEMLPQEAPAEPIYQRPNKTRSDHPSASAKVSYSSTCS